MLRNAMLIAMLLWALSGFQTVASEELKMPMSLCRKTCFFKDADCMRESSAHTDASGGFAADAYNDQIHNRCVETKLDPCLASCKKCLAAGACYENEPSPSASAAPDGAASGSRLPEQDLGPQDSTNSITASPGAAGWLGVQIGSFDKKWADEHKLRTSNGARITKIIPESPVSKTDISEGDVILEVDGQEVDSPRSLARIIAASHAGDSVALLIFKDGKLITTKVTLVVAPSFINTEEEKTRKYLWDEKHEGETALGKAESDDTAATSRKKRVFPKSRRPEPRPRAAASTGDRSGSRRRPSIDPILGVHLPDAGDVMRGLPRPPRPPGE